MMRAVGRGGVAVVRGAWAKRVHSLASASGAAQNEKGLVVGVYSHATQPLIPEEGEGNGAHEDTANKSDSLVLTPAAERIRTVVGSRLGDLLRIAGATGKSGEYRVFYGLFDEFPKIAVVGLGAREYTCKSDPEPHDTVNRINENVRTAAAAGVRALRDLGVKDIELEGFTQPQAAAEGAYLAAHTLDKFKGNNQKKKLPPSLRLNTSFDVSGAKSRSDWDRGKMLADAQNLARELMETPSNHMTPRAFADRITAEMSSRRNLQVRVRDRRWILEKKMGAFLAVAQGSDEEPLFLELEYRGANSPGADTSPLVFVGKGVTFDTGGISIKPSAGMAMMKGDMGGAATVCSAIGAISSLGLDMNAVALVPLCENMPSGKAIKPGDVITAMNGKTIEVDNTDAEGRLLLADALVYAHSFSPKAIIDVATLTGAMDVALGGAAAGVFCTSTPMWELVRAAGDTTGDPFWRMPLYQAYLKQLKSGVADLINVGGKSAGACTAAMFLREFVRCRTWAHIDIAGVMHKGSTDGYLSKGMTGRPTRALVEFAGLLAAPNPLNDAARNKEASGANADAKR